MKNLIVCFLSILFMHSAAFAQENPTFVAKKGDTIYSILRENNLPPSKYLTLFKELNSGKLTKDNGLMVGVKYRLPLSEEVANVEKTEPEKTDSSPASYKTVVAKRGDGISIILNRNGLSPDKYTAEFIALNKKNIGKNNELYVGVKYRLPIDEESPSDELPSTPASPVAYKTVVAKSGDGISILLNRNGLRPDKYTAEFIALNKKNIGKDNSLFAGVSYKLPISDDEPISAPVASNNTPSGNSIRKLNNPLYGSKYQNFNQVSRQLEGAIFYLISGHGGPDPGAHGYYNSISVYEDEYAYDVTLRLSRELESHGAKVYMIIYDKNDGIRDGIYLTADKDERCYPNQSIPLNQTKRLDQRSEAVNALYKKNKGSYQRCIITHIDSRGKNELIDAFFYHDERSTGGKKLAEILYKTFDDKYKNRNNPREYHGTISTRRLYVLRCTLPVAAFIELGNINNSRDIQRIVQESNRQALANWLCEGLIEDYRVNKGNK